MSRFSLFNLKGIDSTNTLNQTEKNISTLDLDTSQNKRNIFERAENTLTSGVSSARSIKTEKTLESTLKSNHYFKKPDIIPNPSINLHDIQDKVDWEEKYHELLTSYEKQKKEKNDLERENDSLRYKVRSLLDLENQFDEVRIKAGRVGELMTQVESLNVRIGILLDENEELRKVIRGVNGGGRRVREIIEF